MPGTDIPVAAPAELAARRPGLVLLFVPDLLAEVREAFPEVETAGGRWVDAGGTGFTPPGVGHAAGPGFAGGSAPMLPTGSPSSVGDVGVGHRRVGHEHLEVGAATGRAAGTSRRARSGHARPASRRSSTAGPRTR